MGVDVNVIFQIAGVGIVVLSPYDFRPNGEERVRSVGDAAWVYLHFVYGGNHCRRFV